MSDWLSAEERRNFKVSIKKFWGAASDSDNATAKWPKQRNFAHYLMASASEVTCPDPPPNNSNLFISCLWDTSSFSIRQYVSNRHEKHDTYKKDLKASFLNLTRVGKGESPPKSIPAGREKSNKMDKERTRARWILSFLLPDQTFLYRIPHSRYWKLIATWNGMDVLYYGLPSFLSSFLSSRLSTYPLWNGD